MTIFPNAKLGDERNLLESMRMGVVDSAIITGGPSSTSCLIQRL
ncbi:hypothetical protein MASR2M79_18960 [Aminivibrio sp.]